MTLATGGDGERIRKKHQIDGQVVLHLGMKAFDKGSVTLFEVDEAIVGRKVRRRG